jgi:hypothetical protein
LVCCVCDNVNFSDKAGFHAIEGVLGGGDGKPWLAPILKMMTEYKLQTLEIPPDWEIRCNQFYDIEPMDDIPESDKFHNIYMIEDMLLLEKGRYHLDLGWYGSDDLKDQRTSYMLVLFRGESWHNCELLELIRSRSKMFITKSINEILKAVTDSFYDNKPGYRIDENDEDGRYIGKHFQYSIRNDLNEIIK